MRSEGQRSAACNGARIGNKIQDYVRDLQGVFADPIDMIGTIQLDEFGRWNMRGEKSASRPGRVLGGSAFKRAQR
jgi:hypothetical protein